MLQIYRNIGKIPQVLSFPLLPNGFTFSVGIERFLFHTLVLEWRHTYVGKFGDLQNKLLTTLQGLLKFEILCWTPICNKSLPKCNPSR